MNDNTWNATISGIALGIGLILVIYLFVHNNQQESGMTYVYDDKDRLQSIIPMNKSKAMRLRPME